jgi:Protein of unknown function (DUF2586)
MPIPSVSVAVQDGALGLLPADAGNSMISLGVCSGGTNDTVYAFGTKEAVISTLGVGPLVEELCHRLDIAGGTVLACKVTGSVAGSNSSVTNSGGGPNMTLSGAPNDDYVGIVKMILGGAVGTATFQVSLDGGDTWSPTIATASTYALDAASPIGHATGITLNFASGTYVATETYSWTSTAPGYSSTNLNTAFDAAIADARDWSLAHVVGMAASVSAAASLAAAIETKILAAATQYRYARAIMQIPQDTDSNIVSGFAAVLAPHVVGMAGFEELVSVRTGRIYKRPASWVAAARAQLVPISEDLSRVARGGLPGVISITRDERATPNLNDNRIGTLRTFVGGQPGFYITNAPLLSGPTSDFRYLQHGRVIDRACSVVYLGLLQYLNASVRINATTGLIDERDARAIDATLQALLEAALTSQGHASAVSVRVVRTDNLLSTQKLRVDIRVTPLGYLKQLEATVGFLNPALQLAA